MTWRNFSEEKINQGLPMMDVLQSLKDEKPDLHKICNVVRKWLWFDQGAIERKDYASHSYLRSMGFKFHGKKERWYHNCGIKCIRSRGNSAVDSGVPVAEASL